ncbi:hypothetical protein ZYGR_0I04360 [Zygosaccharomyces rouxii]|uniref:ZYRO0C10406p n=2 Tax=Zygosaccharomyces rouxii TaxID=4956 RepID=C5DTQ3_ZYGRC|nr:uncharacterized protein ZYRO0C10406g [Zygosaccharomyces rouxii]KAH9201659.1 ribonuclease T2-like protein [Zygosaccharomyces rouxii]GAV48139.1 hypothetical protein ZYGR_0I04360 [Zygosaccharomyces rouxii]CAR27164.1 ZYRO0C10406p [Zygosaccharomyces rouxii]
MLGKDIVRTFYELNQLPMLGAEPDLSSLHIEEPPLIERMFTLSLIWRYQLPQIDVENETPVNILGPLNAFTIHGLWESTMRVHAPAFVDVTKVLQSPELNNDNSLEITGEELLGNLKKYWKDKDGNDEYFWESEYLKHGGSNSSRDVYDYFKMAYDLYEKLNLMQVLQRNLALPSLESHFRRRTIENIISQGFHNRRIQVLCKRRKDLEEFRFSYKLTGPFELENFRPIDAVKVVYPPTCDRRGLRFLPKGASVNRKNEPRLFGYIHCQNMMLPRENGFLNRDGSLEYGGLTGQSAIFELTEFVAGFYELSSDKGSCRLLHGRLICDANDKTAIFTINENGCLELESVPSWYLRTAYPTGKRTIWLSGKQSSILIFKFVQLSL